MNRPLIILLFWLFIATILIFQLLAVDEYGLQKAVIYSTVITTTFAVYVHLALRRIVVGYIESKRFSLLVFRVLLTGLVASVILTTEDYALDSLFDQDWEKHKGAVLARFFGMFMATILISGIAYAFELYRHHIETLKTTQALKDRLNDLELKSIRQQLSPHFTFNVLNNLQFLIQKDKEDALKLLAQYSKILRYYVYESQQKSILLNDEISFLKTYLELEADRLQDEADIDVDISLEPNGLKIAPFILSTFVENAFKHLSISRKWVSVAIGFRDANLMMKVQNTFNSKADDAENGQGIGLEQVRKRLELIYPYRHVLSIDASEDVFTVELKIKFD